MNTTPSSSKASPRRPRPVTIGGEVVHLVAPATRPDASRSPLVDVHTIGVLVRPPPGTVNTAGVGPTNAAGPAPSSDGACRGPRATSLHRSLHRTGPTGHPPLAGRSPSHRRRGRCPVCSSTEAWECSGEARVEGSRRPASTLRISTAVPPPSFLKPRHAHRLGVQIGQTHRPRRAAARCRDAGTVCLSVVVLVAAWVV